MQPDHHTHQHTLDAANAETRAYIDYMTPTWRSNGRRYGLNQHQIERHVAQMVSQTISERQGL